MTICEWILKSIQQVKTGIKNKEYRVEILEFIECNKSKYCLKTFYDISVCSCVSVCVRERKRTGHNLNAFLTKKEKKKFKDHCL